MTKEEALKVIRHMAYLSAHVVENGVEAYEYIEQLLSRPHLPSNLDEAAEEWAKSVYGNPGKSAVSISGVCGFKAGVEWMAEQGETICGIITKVGDRLDVETTEYLSEGSEFERRENVIVQVRKIQ